MSNENVAVVRGIYASWSNGDLRGGAELLDPHVVFIVRAPYPDPGVYHGTEELSGFMSRFLKQFETYTIELREIREAGDTVLAAIRQHGIGKSSGAEVKLDSYMVFTFRAGTIIRIDNVIDEQEALATAGLAE